MTLHSPCHFRKLRLEQLEQRCLLAFDCDDVSGVLTCEGTGGDDSLTAIFVGSNGKIWYETDAFFGEYDSGMLAPSAAAPIVIRIYGYGGKDIVDFFGSTPANNNFGTTPGTTAFPSSSVSNLTFYGGDGDDTFTPPEQRAGGPLTGAVVLPAGGSIPRIKFLGGNGDDTLNNGEHPELFDGDFGNDKVIVGPGATGAGDDVLNGGPGFDTLEGGDGNDTIDGGLERDTIRRRSQRHDLGSRGE